MGVRIFSAVSMILLLPLLNCGSGTNKGSDITSAGSGGTGGVAGMQASGGVGGTTAPTTATGGTSTGGIAGTMGGTSAKPPCDRPETLLCDDFESAAPGAEPGAPRWIAQPAWQNDRIRITDRHAHSGTRAASLTGAPYGVALVPVKEFPMDGKPLYVRVFMRTEKSTADMGGHVSFIEGAEKLGDDGEELRLGASHGMLDVNLIPGSKGSGGGEKTQFSNGRTDIPGDGGPGIVLKPGSWACIEAMFDGKNHRFSAWVDGKLVTGLDVSDWKQGRTGWSPIYRYLKIGGQNFSGATGTLYYDDIVVSTAGPIGCDG
jgi:hypothetical protein